MRQRRIFVDAHAPSQFASLNIGGKQRHCHVFNVSWEFHRPTRYRSRTERVSILSLSAAPKGCWKENSNTAEENSLLEAKQTGAGASAPGHWCLVLFLKSPASPMTSFSCLQCSRNISRKPNPPGEALKPYVRSVFRPLPPSVFELWVRASWALIDNSTRLSRFSGHETWKFVNIRDGYRSELWNCGKFDWLVLGTSVKVGIFRGWKFYQQKQTGKVPYPALVVLPIYLYTSAHTFIRALRDSLRADYFPTCGSP